jgi:hypothetical protein
MFLIFLTGTKFAGHSNPYHVAPPQEEIACGLIIVPGPQSFGDKPKHSSSITNENL